MILTPIKSIFVSIRKFFRNFFSKSPKLFKYSRNFLEFLSYYKTKFEKTIIIKLRNLLFLFEFSFNDFILKQETAKLLAKQIYKNYFNRIDTVVRYLAIENYYGKNDYGFKLYNKMQKHRVPTLKNVNWEENFKKLIINVEKYGYSSYSNIVIDLNYKLVDGSHRFALALFSKEKEIPVKVVYKKTKIKYGIDWFKRNSFTKEEISLIENKKNEILREWDIKNLIIREKLFKILNPREQTFGRGKFYQSLPQLSIIGQRSTEKRFKIYKLEKILNKDQEVLDIGCNVGFFDIFISKHIKHIDGIDINKKLIYIGNMVKNYLKINNISFFDCSFEDFKLDKKYDMVFLFAIYHWTSYSFTEFLFKVKKLLKPNGYIIIESHNIHTIDKTFDERISYIEKMALKKLWDGKIKDDGDIERKYAILQLTM